MRRYSALKESVAAIKEMKEEAIARENKSKLEESAEMDRIRYERESVLEDRRSRERLLGEYTNKVVNEMMGVALKGIYITALERTMEMDKNNYALAETLVDRFIAEQGGAKDMLIRMEGKTYLLSTISNIIKEAEEEAVENTDTDAKDMSMIPDETKEEMLDKMENETDVDNAVELIAQRISDAEEEFIKKNAEDKAKIENIVNDINERINAVKADPTISDEDKEQIEQEHAIELKRKTNDVYDNRRHGVFEHMVHEMTNNILKDNELKEIYTTEDSKLDVPKIVNSAKCLYGFLEFVNTTQLVTVDEAYIKKVLEEM